MWVWTTSTRCCVCVDNGACWTRHVRGASSVPTQPHASLCAARTPPLVILLTIRSGVHQPAVLSGHGVPFLIAIICFTAVALPYPDLLTGWILCAHMALQGICQHAHCYMCISGLAALHEYKKLSQQLATRLRRGFFKGFSA